MIRINTIKEITFKELKAQFDHLSGYILITIVLSLLYFFFLKTFFVNGVSSMRSLFNLLPWYLAIFVPAITMGSFASEVEKQTLEYLETKPIKQIELIIGKILGATKIVFITILLTLPLPFFINRIAPLDIGETISGYIGAFILSLALVSLGVAVSTFFKSQIVSFITSAVLIVILIIINSDITAINLATPVVNTLAQFSIVDNYDPIIRGVVSLNNLVYFVIFIALSVAIAYTNIQKIRISKTTELYKRTFSIIIVVAVAGITLVYLSNYFGQQVGRIDLTSTKRYTLSPVTTDILNEKGKTIIEVYASDNLPPKYKSVFEEIKNLLTDYRSAARGNLEVRYIDPKTNGEKLSTLNIQPVQFNTVGEDQVQIQQGYLALVVMNENESQKEKIDYIPAVDDLEYQITSLINKIKSVSKPAVGFVAGNGEKGITTDYTFLQKILQSEYDLRTVYLKGAATKTTPPADSATPLTDPKLSQYNLLVIADPKDNYDETSTKQIDDYIKAGGNVLYLGDSQDIDMSTLLVTPITNSGQILSAYGATVNKDMIYDTQSSLVVPFNETVSMKYPYFVLAPRDPNADSAIQFLPESILDAWGSSLNLDSHWQWLYSTSATGGKKTGDMNLDPQAKLPEQNLRLPLVAYRKTDSGGTLVISGSSKIFEDQFAGSIQENAVLALALFENMGKGKGLSQIKVKNLTASQFNNVDSRSKQMVNYWAPASSAVLLILIGSSRIYRKKKLARIYA